MMRLVDLGIPAPTQITYSPYAASYVRGDLARIGDGLASVSWVWDVISIPELATLMNIYFDAVTDTYAHDRYVRTDYRTGDYADPAAAFITRKCTVWRPRIFGPDGTPIATSTHGVQAVNLVFTNLEAP